MSANTALDRSVIILEKSEWNIQVGLKLYAEGDGCMGGVLITPGSMKLVLPSSS